jgi:hypothetical protein
MSVEETKAHPDYEIVGVEIAPRLASILMPTGELIQFDSLGGAYNPSNRAIVGTGPKGDSIVVVPTTDAQLAYVFEIGERTDTVKAMWGKVRGRLSFWRKSGSSNQLYPPLQVVEMKRGSARIDESSDQVVGLGDEGSSVSVHTDQVALYRLNTAWPNSPKRIGVMGGVNAGSFGGEFPSEVEVSRPRKVGGEIGLFATYPLSGKFLFQPEIHYSLHRAKIKQSGRYGQSQIEVTDDIQVRYFLAPLLLKYRLSDYHSSYPTLFAGPMLMFASGATCNYDSLSTGQSFFSGSLGTRTISNRKKFSAAVLLGADYQMTVSRVHPFVTIRYALGLSGAFGEGKSELDSRSYESSSGTALPLKMNSLSLALGVSVPW